VLEGREQEVGVDVGDGVGSEAAVVAIPGVDAAAHGRDRERDDARIGDDPAVLGATGVEGVRKELLVGVTDRDDLGPTGGRQRMELLVGDLRLIALSGV
jgi:hypothetical protein